MDLSTIIVNWNSAAYTAECVASICELTHDMQYEIIVVDNASTDNSVEVLREIPGIRLVCSSENVGFARANNLGFHQSSGRIVLFLNPDTKLVNAALSRMYACLETFPALGVVGCKLLNADRTIQTTCVQPFPTIVNQVTDIERLKLLLPNTRMWGIHPLFATNGSEPAPAEAVSGACLMIKRNVFAQIGFFSTEYFMYGEDLDLCYKVRKAGWQVAHVPDAVIVHYGGQSTKQKRDAGFGDVATRQAVYTFLAKTRGELYAKTYRVCMGAVSIPRLAVFCVLRLLPIKVVAKEYVLRATRKWSRILRWSLGWEEWAEHLAQSGGGQAARIQS